ncbi:hypothetical protein ACKUUI_02325 [Mycobacterium seoulense]
MIIVMTSVISSVTDLMTAATMAALGASLRFDGDNADRQPEPDRVR